MRRRDFMAFLGGATAVSAASAIGAGAQVPAKVRRVGYIARTSDAVMGHTVGAFRQGLADLGYVEGQSIALEVRWAEGHAERYAELVTELIGLNMDVLVVGNSMIAHAARKATSTIPIVMVAADPVGLGLVDSLARPGGNVTGLSYFNEQMIAKRSRRLLARFRGRSASAGDRASTSRSEPARGFRRCVRLRYDSQRGRSHRLRRCPDCHA